MIYRDFVLSWRDMEQARQIGMPIDLGAVSAAANACAQKEDLMIFAGNPKAGYEGLATAEGAFKVKNPTGAKMKMLSAMLLKVCSILRTRI